MNYYRDLVNQAMRAKFFFTLLENDLFSELENWTTADDLSKRRGLQSSEAEILLEIMSELDLVERAGNRYRTCPKLSKIYSGKSPTYLGAAQLAQIKNFEKTLARLNLQASPQNAQAETLATQDTATGQTEIKPDFTKFFARSRSEVKLFRGPYLQALSAAYSIPKNAKILDLGGACGALGASLKTSENSLYIFDSPEVLAAVDELPGEGLAGDFNCDSWQGPYDLILASGILDFVDFESGKFFKLLNTALKPGAYVFFYWLCFDPALRGIRDLRWLSQRLAGKVLPDPELVRVALEELNLEHCETRNDGLYPLAIYRKRNN